MRPGPKPKPLAVRTFEGTMRAYEHQNDYAPDPDSAEILTVPEWMGSEFDIFRIPEPEKRQEALVKFVWHKMAPILEKMGVLKNADELTFGRYCDTLARWMEAKFFLDRNGSVFPIYEYVTTKEPIPTGKKNSDGTPEFQKNQNGYLTQRTVTKKVLKSMKKFPQVEIYSSLTQMLSRYEAEFGIGAATRTKIITLPKAGDSPFNGSKEGGPKTNAFDYAARRRAAASGGSTPSS